MRGLMRLLFMFGPMILRQVQKYQRNKERQRHYQQGQPPLPQEAPRRRRKETPPPPPRKPELSEEEKNFRLKEEDIMLDNETLDDYKSTQSASHEMDYTSNQPEAPKRIEAEPTKPTVNEGELVPSGDAKKDSDDGFDLKDLFFEDIDEENKDQE